jgi:multicomponent K+:H+ antiporter subunit F
MSELGPIVSFSIQAGLAILVLLLIPCAYRVYAGPNPADRLQAIDTTTILLMGIIVMLALVQGIPFLIDIGIALSAFAFVGTLAISRYLSEGRVF